MEGWIRVAHGGESGLFRPVDEMPGWYVGIMIPDGEPMPMNARDKWRYLLRDGEETWMFTEAEMEKLLNAPD